MNENQHPPSYEVSRDREAAGGVSHTVAEQHRAGDTFFAPMSESWVKIHRKIQHHDLWNMKPEYLKIWLYLIMNANHDDRERMAKGRRIIVRRGEILTSIERIAIDCRLTKATVKSCIKWCSINRLIVIYKSPRVSHLCICKYNDLQGIGSLKVAETSPISSLKVAYKKNKEVRSKKEEYNTSIARSADASEPVAIGLQQNNGEDFPITQSQIESWQKLYPAVDVMQALRSMRGWLDANPTRRKTARGMMKFANSWLSREQDRNNNGNNNGQRKRTAGDRVMGSDYVGYIESIANEHRANAEAPGLFVPMARPAMVAVEARPKD